MISVAILTKNSQETLKKVLESTISFPEVIILDTGSTDNTLSIAKTFSNVKIFSSSFTTFGALRNLAASYASNSWILALDSDEVLSSKLIDEIHNLQLKNNTLYSFPFHNFFNNKQIKSCGWYPEKHIRLYNKKSTEFSASHVHEQILLKREMTVSHLQNPVLHTPYRKTEDFLFKLQLYSNLFADQNRNKKKSSFFKALVHGVYAFFKSYFLKRGFIDGKEGFIISFYNGETAFYKYVKLLEKNTKHSC